MTNRKKIHFLIERFFIIAGLIILTATLLVGLYFNKYDEQEKRKNNLQKIHGMLSQLIVPSLVISDLSEVRRLLYMASGDEETFLVVDNDGTVIMPDYDKSLFSKFILDSYKSSNDCRNLEITYQYIGNKKYLINCSILKNTEVLPRGKKVGVLLSFTNYKWFSFSPIIFYFVIILIGLFLFLIILFRRMLYRQLLRPLVTLKDRISDISMASTSSNSYIDEISNAPKELVEIKEAFERLLLSLQGEYGKRIEAGKMKALIDLAAGVAHDIRSPLIALDVIIKDIKNIPEEQRIVIRNSANRINDIANNLLTQYRQRKNADSDDSARNMKPELISDLLMSLISEKRVQHRNDSIKLILNVEENAYGRFSVISVSAFNRVLSNLIDNAIEADANEITVSLKILNPDEKSNLKIQIKDNGKGILPGTLQKILKGESVSSKAKGHGLGLPHAIKTIEKEWSGRLHINSFINDGTTIDIVLPQVPAPKWFLSKLIINPKESIVILDDDESIHQVWKERFKEVYADFNFIHHYNPQDLLSWYKDNSSVSSIFLIDYEFIGCDKNGLNIIEELEITDRSYLVTSRHEDLAVREYSEKMGIKIIPKTFAVYIPILLSKNNANKQADLIFIDDDAVITGAWVLHGIARGKVVAAYNSVRAFKIDRDQFNFDTPVFIDSNLNDVVKGQDVAKELYEDGFMNIYLATGYAAADFPEMHWIKEIVGKSPPF